jgi:Flp pilus assembly secretin CpaC
MRLENSMAAFVARRGRWPGVFLASMLLASSMALPGAAHAADLLTVHLDQAAVLKLPDRTATLIIGNPLIADAVVQAGDVAVITAKSYGVTNLVALDSNGSTLMERPIQVLGSKDRTVVVYRGVERETYSCAPDCERRITLGDGSAYFNGNLTQVGTFSSHAKGEGLK